MVTHEQKERLPQEVAGLQGGNTIFFFVFRIFDPTQSAPGTAFRSKMAADELSSVAHYNQKSICPSFLGRQNDMFQQGLPVHSH
jgi:hypothetical protein